MGHEIVVKVAMRVDGTIDSGISRLFKEDRSGWRWRVHGCSIPDRLRVSFCCPTAARGN